MINIYRINELVNSNSFFQNLALFFIEKIYNVDLQNYEHDNSQNTKLSEIVQKENNKYERHLILLPTARNIDFAMSEFHNTNNNILRNIDVRPLGDFLNDFISENLTSFLANIFANKHNINQNKEEYKLAPTDLRIYYFYKALLRTEKKYKADDGKNSLGVFSLLFEQLRDANSSENDDIDNDNSNDNNGSDFNALDLISSHYDNFIKLYRELAIERIDIVQLEKYSQYHDYEHEIKFLRQLLDEYKSVLVEHGYYDELELFSSLQFAERLNFNFIKQYSSITIIVAGRLNNYELQLYKFLSESIELNLFSSYFIFGEDIFSYGSLTEGDLSVATEKAKGFVERFHSFFEEYLKFFELDNIVELFYKFNLDIHFDDASNNGVGTAYLTAPKKRTLLKSKLYFYHEQMEFDQYRRVLHSIHDALNVGYALTDILVVLPTIDKKSYFVQFDMYDMFSVRDGYSITESKLAGVLITTLQDMFLESTGMLHRELYSKIDDNNSTTSHKKFELTLSLRQIFGLLSNSVVLDELSQYKVNPSSNSHDATAKNGKTKYEQQLNDYLIKKFIDDPIYHIIECGELITKLKSDIIKKFEQSGLDINKVNDLLFIRILEFTKNLYELRSTFNKTKLDMFIDNNGAILNKETIHKLRNIIVSDVYGKAIFDFVQYVYSKLNDNAEMFDLSALSMINNLLVELTVNYERLDDELITYTGFDYIVSSLVEKVLRLQLPNIKYKDDGRDSDNAQPQSKVDVMSVLETRNLSYKVVIAPFLDEAYFPIKAKKDMFLNTDIRRALRLPTFIDSENLQKNYYYQLFNRAERCIICSSSNEEVRHSHFIDEIQFYYGGKFIEQELPQNDYGFIFNTNTTQQNKKTTKFAIANEKELVFTKTPAIMKKLAEMTYSNSSFDKYRRCSLQFYLCYVAGLRDNDILETLLGAESIFLGLDIAPNELGSYLHSSLEQVFLYYDKNGVEPTEDDFAKRLQNYIEQNIKQHPSMSYSQTTRFIVMSILENVLDIARLEGDNWSKGWRFHNAEIELNFKSLFDNVNMKGYIDRIDINKEERKYRVIDYKYKSADGIKKTVMRLDKLENYLNDLTGKTREPINNSFQLLLYAYMLELNKNEYGLGDYELEGIYFYAIKEQIELINGVVGLPDDEDKIQGMSFAFELLKAYFENKFAELHNPEIPFTQTQDWQICRYCRYTAICNR